MIVALHTSGLWLERSLLLLSLFSLGGEGSTGVPQEDEPGSGKYKNLVALPEGYVRFARVPAGGRGPRVVTDDGRLALLYFEGEARGDLFLARSGDEGQSFTPSVRVNPEPGTVATVGGSHTGAISMGPDGTVHVVWRTDGERSALLYSRIGAGGEVGAPLDLGAPPGLCSTPAVTLDRRGEVFVFYVAPDAAAEGQEGQDGDGGRVNRVWLRRSGDGASFSDPVAVDAKAFGVSDESAMAAHADPNVGSIYVLYRSRYLLKPDAPNVNRGMRLLFSDGQADFDAAWVDNWRQPRDPRSSAGLAPDPNTTIAVWDSGGQVFWATIRRQFGKVNLPMEPRFDGPPVVRSHPAGAGSGGDVLMAWIERPKDDPEGPRRLGWRVWERFTRAPLGDGYAPELPGTSTPAAFVRADGGYTILY